jgi:quercetin dioxygenase-like cupin family protein
MKFKKARWEDVNIENLDPKLKQQVYTTEKVMLVRYVYDPGLHFPEHSHPQEQTTIIEKGKLIFSIEEDTIELKKGEILTIPPHVKHSTLVPENEQAIALTIFSPVSETVIIDK